MSECSFLCGLNDCGFISWLWRVLATWCSSSEHIVAPGRRYAAAILDIVWYLKMCEVDLETYLQFRRHTSDLCRPSGGLLWKRHWTCGFRNNRGNSWRIKRRTAYKERLYCGVNYFGLLYMAFLLYSSNLSKIGVIFNSFATSPNVSCCSSHVFHLCCCYSSGIPCFNSPSFAFK